MYNRNLGPLTGGLFTFDQDSASTLLHRAHQTLAAQGLCAFCTDRISVNGRNPVRIGNKSDLQAAVGPNVATASLESVLDVYIAATLTRALTFVKVVNDDSTTGDSFWVSFVREKPRKLQKLPIWNFVTPPQPVGTHKYLMMACKKIDRDAEAQAEANDVLTMVHPNLNRDQQNRQTLLG